MDAGIKSLANPSFPAVAFLFEYGITGMAGNRKWSFCQIRFFSQERGEGAHCVCFPPFNTFWYRLSPSLCNNGISASTDCEALINCHRFSCISNSDYCKAQICFPAEIKVREKTDPTHSFFSRKEQRHKSREIRDVMANQAFIAWCSFQWRLFGVKPQGFGQWLWTGSFCRQRTWSFERFQSITSLLLLGARRNLPWNKSKLLLGNRDLSAPPSSTKPSLLNSGQFQSYDTEKNCSFSNNGSVYPGDIPRRLWREGSGQFFKVLIKTEIRRCKIRVL